MIGKSVILAAFIACLAGVVVFRAMFLFKPLPEPKLCNKTSGHERIKLTDAMLARFKVAINIATISYSAGKYHPERLEELISHIEASYPTLHSAKSARFVSRERVANYTLLYTIEGTERDLNPYMLTSHLDVVPAVDSQWSSDPFVATLKPDGHLYGRGTIDAKHLVMAMLEALERMLSTGFRPKRTLFLVFGHDEEVGGGEGATCVARLLESRLAASQWSKLEYILDEGTIVATDGVPGVDMNIGLVGVVEKGYLTVRLSTTGAVGHGSMPPELTAISRLSRAVAKFSSHIMPSYVGEGAEREIIETLALYARWPHKLLYSNFWLFKPLIGYAMGLNPTTNAFIRTTTAVTLVEGGTKENVLPDSASAHINHRVHPRQTVEQVLDFDRRLVDDPAVQVEIAGVASNPTPVAPYGPQVFGYQTIKRSVLQVFPNTVVVPSTFLGASDSRWYTKLSDCIYKFSAICVHSAEMKRFHGHDERISLANYENLINFYHHVIENSDNSHLTSPWAEGAQRSEL